MINETIKLPEGAFFHARPCAVIAGGIKELNCAVFFFSGSSMADASNAISLMKLGHPADGTIEVMADGPDAQRAMETVRRKLEEAFH